MNFEIVVGLETHVQLSTASKIFSGASTAFGAAPNTQASAALRMSGSETISSSGVPARLRSMPETSPNSGGRPSCSDLPASSSRCARTRRMRFSPASVAIATLPPCTTGISNCEIW